MWVEVVLLLIVGAALGFIAGVLLWAKLLSVMHYNAIPPGTGTPFPPLLSVAIDFRKLPGWKPCDPVRTARTARPGRPGRARRAVAAAVLAAGLGGPLPAREPRLPACSRWCAPEWP